MKEREKCGLEARRGPREANGQQLPITSIIAITAEQLNSQPKTASLHKHSHTRLLPVKSAITCHWGKNVKGMETWAGTREDGERGMGIVGGGGWGYKGVGGDKGSWRGGGELLIGEHTRQTVLPSRRRSNVQSPTGGQQVVDWERLCGWPLWRTASTG